MRSGCEEVANTSDRRWTMGHGPRHQPGYSDEQEEPLELLPLEGVGWRLVATLNAKLRPWLLVSTWLWGPWSRGSYFPSSGMVLALARVSWTLS